MTAEQKANLEQQGFVFVEGGAFEMGGDKGAKKDEKPKHKVTLDDFWICDHPVTQQEYLALMRFNPSEFISDKNRPVESVNWEQAEAYCKELNKRNKEHQVAGMEYRLPTEAEWEYAAKGGEHKENTTYAGSDKVDDVAWCKYKDQTTHLKATQPVKKLNPNALKLYDMSGNVWEWCNDWYDESYYKKCVKDSLENNPEGPLSGINRVYRGGCWRREEAGCRSVNRASRDPIYRCNDVGFRVVFGRKLSESGRSGF
ncbi:MAG: formylglycine-generating enzyme family protein [Chitinophagia bacterium]|nr:formylglycine-generating enzyme family protein [Chitinophagia bacterium]